jgi:hypothetical protein
MSQGGENVRRMQKYLHPFSEHLIDWFHITMRLTVLQQQVKALKEERPQIGADVSKPLESVKHLLWHGNAEEALDRLVTLIMDLNLIQAHSAPADKVATSIAEFETYIRNNSEFIPNFGERRTNWTTLLETDIRSSALRPPNPRLFVGLHCVILVLPGWVRFTGITGYHEQHSSRSLVLNRVD